MPGPWDVQVIAGATTRDVLDLVTPPGRTQVARKAVITVPAVNTEGGMSLVGDTTAVVRSILSGELRAGLSKQLKKPVDEFHRLLLHLQNTDTLIGKGASSCSTYLWLGETHRTATHAALIRSAVRAAVLAMSHPWPYHQTSGKSAVRVCVYMEHALALNPYVRDEDLSGDTENILNNTKEGEAPTLVTREEDTVSRVIALWNEHRSRFMLEHVSEMTTETNDLETTSERTLYVIITGGLHTSHLHSILSPRFPEENGAFKKDKEIVSHVFVDLE